MVKGTVYLFTRNGLGNAPEDLQRILAVNFLGLVADSGRIPEKVLFYGDGVKLACEGSDVIEGLKGLESQGSRLILCRTCLEYFGLIEKVHVGTVGKMTDILAALQEADRVVSL
jgi:sulfur relay (sulfurtransferase) complex TusBCD TusD component (DsrE family)